MMPNFDSIPEELKVYPNWVLWKLEERDGKYTKIPYQVYGKRADTTNPKTWATFESVKETFLNSKRKYNGIGFVLTEKAGIIGADWDKVRDPITGDFDKEALEEILCLFSYGELSQSETGAHVLIKGKIPGDRRRKGNFEMYCKDRFFVVTGQHIEDTPLMIKENQEAINGLYEKKFGEEKQTISKRHLTLRNPDLTDEEIIQLCRTAGNNEKFTKLYDKGDCSDYEDDESRADLALCGLIAFYTQKREQIDRIFSSSKLYRDKWDRTDYKNETIRKALSNVKELYTGTKGKRKSKEEEPEKINVPFDIVAKRILKMYHIFTLRDNKQIFLYKDGVYRSEGSEAILDTVTRNIHDEIYREFWYNVNPAFPLTHIPKATTKYVNEVFAYIRAYSHVTRNLIEANQEKYINLKNGLFDLEKWKLEPHTPNIILIRQIPVDYEETAICPQISKFLDDVVIPVDKLGLCEIAGYCLTTDCSYQKAFLLYGEGSNGKSVYLALLAYFIGEENTSAESLQKLEFDKYRTAKLYGKLVNICGDIPDTKMHKSEVFKKLVSGLDLIDGENKYQEPFKFRNTAKLVFSGNDLPEGKKEKAYYRRWHLIQFPHSFEEGKEDKRLIEKLTDPAELSGFLNLALEGLKRLTENGKFSNSKSVKETQREYEMNSNPIAAFMDECIEVCPNDLDATILYSFYTA